MSLDGGELLDSRQPLDSDEGSLVAHRTLAGSVLWWRVALSVAAPTLDDMGEGAHGVIIGGQSLKELRSDGAVVRRALRGLLRGRAVSVDTVPGARHQEVPEGYTNLGSIAYRVTDPAATWQIIGFDMVGIATDGQAAVIIDTGTWPYAGHRPDHAEFERARLGGVGLLILPHTPRTEQYVRSYSSWLCAGDGPLQGREIEGARERPDRPEFRLHRVQPVPLSAEFAVTGWVEGGEWRDPSDLEAARTLLAARYDLKLGLWDLARNSTLRDALLHPSPVEPVAPGVAPLPATAVSRAKVLAGELRSHQTERRESKETIGAKLANFGWVTRGHETGAEITLPLREWVGKFEPFTLLYLTLSITERRCAVSVADGMDGQMTATGRYVTKHWRSLAEIAAPDTCLAREGRTLWRCAGGWADALDWEERVAAIGTRTKAWFHLFAALGEELADRQGRAEAREIAKWVREGWPADRVPGMRP